MNTKTKTSTSKTLNKKNIASKAKATKTKAKKTTIKPKQKELFPTKICIKYDAGFSNNLYVRGEGAGLSWDKGIPCKNTGPNNWVWETSKHFITCKFKVLINDKEYEQGDDHILHVGSVMEYTPNF